jgi:hypothetical protein
VELLHQTPDSRNPKESRPLDLEHSGLRAAGSKKRKGGSEPSDLALRSVSRRIQRRCARFKPRLSRRKESFDFMIHKVPKRLGPSIIGRTCGKDPCISDTRFEHRKSQKERSLSTSQPVKSRKDQNRPFWRTGVEDPSLPGVRVPGDQGGRSHETRSPDSRNHERRNRD